MNLICRGLGLAALSVVFSSASVYAQVPSFSSRADAAYTLYLNFGGFDFTGSWGNTGRTPGYVPAYSIDSNTSSFTATELANIKNIWAQVAEQYVAFDINVTTVDPAAAAGQAGTDFQRQKYYDGTARLVHNIIGGSNAWYGGAGGVSYVDVAQHAFDTSANGGAGAGWKTNWTFTAGGWDWSGVTKNVGVIASHEIGHALGCGHQCDFHSNNTLANGYSSGNGSGNGSYAPTMGNSYDSQRSTWRKGDAGSTNNRYTQNDVAVIARNSGLSFADDGIGHTFGSATPLAISSGTVDSMQAKGFLRPTDEENPDPMGEENYTTDFFSFRATGGQVTLNLRNGSQYLTPGVADPGATLRSRLRIYDRFGNLVGTGVEDGSTMFSTFTGNLGAGDYFAQISSYGGFAYAGDYNMGYYYDMGSYFLTGSGNMAPVPEPATLAALGLGVAAFIRRRKK